MPINNGLDKKLDKFFNNNRLETLQLLHRQWEVFEFGFFGTMKAVGYDGYNDYNGSTDIHLGRESPRHLKDLWSIIIDTGVAVSVCAMTFCEHIAVTTMPESARRQFVTVTGEVANAQSALLGLPDVDENNVTVHTGKQPYLEKNGMFEHLHPHGAHLHAAALVLPGLHKPNDVKIDMAVISRYDPNKPTTIIGGGVDDISQQANIPKQLCQPPQPTKPEQEQQRIAHMPYNLGAQSV
eukprot:98003-Amphidinium_carterae.2